MTWSDPIVDEVRRVRDAYAARFNYDLRAIYRDLKEQEKRSGRKVVSCSSVPPEDELEKILPSIGPAPAVSDTAPMQQTSPTTERGH
jgi:hypothetical protein